MLSATTAAFVRPGRRISALFARAVEAHLQARASMTRTKSSTDAQSPTASMTPAKKTTVRPNRRGDENRRGDRDRPTLAQSSFHPRWRGPTHSARVPCRPIVVFPTTEERRSRAQTASDPSHSHMRLCREQSPTRLRRDTAPSWLRLSPVRAGSSSLAKWLRGWRICRHRCGRQGRCAVCPDRGEPSAPTQCTDRWSPR